MHPGPTRLEVVLAEVGEDPLLAVEDPTVVGHEHRNRVGARGGDEIVTFPLVGRNLPDDVIDSELRQALAHAMRGRTPLGLEELEHRPHTPDPTRPRSPSSCFRRLPHTSSHRAKTP